MPPKQQKIEAEDKSSSFTARQQSAHVLASSSSSDSTDLFTGNASINLLSFAEADLLSSRAAIDTTEGQKDNDSSDTVTAEDIDLTEDEYDSAEDIMATRFDITKLNITPFDGDDFTMWKFKLKTILAHAKLSEVIVKDAKAKEDQKNEFNLIMMQALSTRQLLHIYNLEEPSLQWAKLLELHENASEDRVRTLTEELFNIKMSPEEDLATFLSKVMNIRARLLDLQETIKDSMVITLILNKLPPAYEQFRISWNQLSGTEATLTKLQSKLLQESFRLKEKNPVPMSQVMEAGVKSGGRSRGRSNASGGSSYLSKVVCFYCGIDGHKRNECRKLKEDVKNGSVHPNKIKPGNSSRGKPDEERDHSVMSAFHTSGNQESIQVTWLADSGATDHICPYEEWFDELSPVDLQISTATGQQAQVLGRGSIKVWSCGEVRLLKDVLYIPSCTKALFSLGTCASRGLVSKISGDKLCLKSEDGKVVAVGHLKNKLFYMDFMPIIKSEVYSSVAGSSSEAVGTPLNLELWHRRLAHVNLKKVQQTIKYRGSLPDQFYCVGCIHGKAHRQSFPKDGKSRVEKPGELVHMDIAGPMSASFGGAKYFLLLKDDFSGYLFFYPMSLKSQSLDCFKKFLLDFRTLTKGKCQVLRLRSDNGSEFMATVFQSFLLQEKIKHETSVPYNPQQNGYIERSMRTVTEAARSMIHSAGCSTQLWAEACSTACFILNLVPLGDNDKSPSELVTGFAPDLKYLRIFGSKAFVLKRSEERHKWDKKTREAILVGYESGTKSYRLWDPEDRKLIRSRDVKIIEPPLVPSSPLPEDDWFAEVQPLSSTTSTSDSEVVSHQESSSEVSTCCSCSSSCSCA